MRDLTMRVTVIVCINTLFVLGHALTAQKRDSKNIHKHESKIESDNVTGYSAPNQ